MLGQHRNTVQVIWHDRKLIQTHVRMMLRNGFPAFLCRDTKWRVAALPDAPQWRSFLLLHYQAPCTAT